MGYISTIKLPDNSTYAIKAAYVNGHTVGVDVPSTAVFTDTTYTYYGTSSASASTATKEVTCSGFKLTTGEIISIKFSNANTVSGNIKLKIDTISALDIYVKNANTSSSNPLLWDANDILLFTYDGTRYRFLARESANIPLTESEIETAVEAGWSAAITNADITSY